MNEELKKKLGAKEFRVNPKSVVDLSTVDYTLQEQTLDQMIHHLDTMQERDASWVQKIYAFWDSNRRLSPRQREILADILPKYVDEVVCQMEEVPMAEYVEEIPTSEEYLAMLEAQSQYVPW